MAGHMRACTGSATAGAATDAARTSFMEEVVAHLAQVLKDSGFSAALRNANAGNAAAEEAVSERQRERQEQLKAATRRLIVAGLLASACLTGHLAHIWPGRLTHVGAGAGTVPSKPGHSVRVASGL